MYWNDCTECEHADYQRHGWTECPECGSKEVCVVREWDEEYDHPPKCSRTSHHGRPYTYECEEEDDE